ncbi:hypothetical protein [Corynebacterium lactis]|uniref:Uncharacterized protein n=1 Tax=Corynebacterium lactis RW2-5 TaxID=1408189 RepID=A0A0K2H3C7_9CORY|nr:hypothetical protein [Corynebacterium lactis]ALA68443.1 hypothetical protein CLAC_03370 [Corynebacterium lactis RW2-5]
MTRRALAGRFILTTEPHPHGTHLKIKSTKSAQKLVVVEEEIKPLAHAMLNITRPPRYKVWGTVIGTLPTGKRRTWSVAQAGNEATTGRTFTTWQEAMRYANQQAKGGTKN